MSEVPQTILRQLGGNKFIAMTGAKNLVGGKDNLTCKVMTGQNEAGQKVNLIRITLRSDDTYTIETFFVRGVDCQPRKKRENIYVESLIESVSSMTGLALKL